jgi:hypothetical protein
MIKRARGCTALLMKHGDIAHRPSEKELLSPEFPIHMHGAG